MTCYELANNKLLVAPDGENGVAVIITELEPRTRTAPDSANIIPVGHKKMAASLLSPRQQKTYTAGKEPVEISKEKKIEIEKVISILKKRI